jgi:hypothetical protein
VVFVRPSHLRGFHAVPCGFPLFVFVLNAVHPIENTGNIYTVVKGLHRAAKRIKNKETKVSNKTGG